jgi:hypothetical protein
MLNLVDSLYRTERKIDRWRFASVIEEQKQAPEHWDKWTVGLFPNLFNKPFSERHIELWEWFEALRRGIKPSAFFAIWPRSGGKSTNVEAGVVSVGANEQRKFCLYVRGIQDKANESVQNISSMLESESVARYYPLLTERKLGKYGNSKGWKVNTLRCANGFNVVALGFDAAVRGIKIEEFRPDLIVLDDIDSLGDTLDTTNKKIEVLTKSILPAGSDDVAVVGIQNLIKWNGIFHKIAQNKADFLLNRTVSGPYPAMEDLQYKTLPDGTFYITGGNATWEGQNIETCQDQMNDWGEDAFLHEAQHLVHKRTGRVYHAFTQENIYQPGSKDLDYSQVSGYYHSHDFGAVNHVWGLWAKIGRQYYLIHEQKLPEGTTEMRSVKIKEIFGDKKVVAGWGGAASEKQYRLDFANHGINIRTPPTVLKSSEDQIVESQVRQANTLFGNKTLIICSDMVFTLDQVENCVRDEKGGIADKASFHFLDMVRYFGVGISRSGWAR